MENNLKMWLLDQMDINQVLCRQCQFLFLVWGYSQTYCFDLFVLYCNDEFETTAKLQNTPKLNLFLKATEYGYPDCLSKHQEREKKE